MVTPSSISSVDYEPSAMPTSSTAATQGGPVTDRLDLLVLDEDGAWQPVAAANRAIDQLRVSDPAPVGLGVGREGRALPVLELRLEHVDEGPLGGGSIRKRMVGEWPGVPLTPEAVHEGVHELDERVAVELRGQERVQLAERVLEERVS